MLGLVIVVVLGTTVLVGTTLGGRYQVAPPVLLLCLGGVIALLPGLTDIELELDWRGSTSCPRRPILCQLLGARPARCVDGAGSMRHVKQPAVALCTWR